MIEKLNPPGVHETPGYHHVTVVSAGPLAFFAGQCPLDESGTVVGLGDHLAQTDQVIANARTVLTAAGAQPDQVIRSTIYVVSDDAKVLASVWLRLNDSELGPAFSTASTLVGVASLGFSGQLVELDLTAALDQTTTR